MSAAAKTQDAVEVLPEQQLLGLMLADRKSCVQAITQCPAALMRDPFHRRIFDAIRRAADSGQGTTPLQIRAVLKNDPAWALVGEDYLQSLKLASPATQEVSGLIDRLRSEFCGDGRTAYELKSAESLGQVSPPDYLIKGVMAPGEWSVIYGEPGCGKSFLACWMAYSVSVGRPVFGRRVRPAPVVFAALEGQLGFERRLHALKDQFGTSQDFHWIGQSVDLYSGQGDIEGLIDAVLRVDARLLVIDTLARAMGPASENEGRDMAIIINAIDFIKRETGAHVCLIHHTGKDSTKGMRGHSSLLGAADVTQEVKRENGDRLVRIAKSKDGKDGDEHSFALEVIELGQDDDGDQITTCAVRETVATPKAPPTTVLTTTEKAWHADLIDLFAAPNAAQMTVPVSGLTARPTLTRGQVCDGLKGKSRFALKPDGKLTGADRQLMSANLNALKNKGKIGMTDKLVWLTQERQ